MDVIDLNVKRLTSELHALTEVAKTITVALDLPELLNAILDKIIGVLKPAQIGAVMLWDQSAGLFRPVAAFGYNADILSKIGLRAGESITGKVYDGGKARLLKTPDEVARAMGDMRLANRAVLSDALNSDALPICTLAAPISAGGQKYGVLVLETLSGPTLFTEKDIPFVQILADLIALAIERARLEAKADAVREAREAERLRSELMATLSHELRLPLTAIKGYVSALLLEEVDWSQEKQNEFLGKIDDECDHMQVMLTDILDSSLIEVDQLAMEPQPLRLQKLAGEVCAEMQRRTKQHQLIVDLPTGFPIVHADPLWIKQVFRNILENAIKYSPEGGLILVQGEQRTNDVIISISDQGIGISPEDLIPLFEKYFRVRSPDGLRIPGTGLGLPIARTIVEAHGGRIWAESKIGEGTTLSFSLPCSAHPPESSR
jgi:K+-sensing histidine kinase KdpD